MFDSDLAELYGVSTKHLNQQVKRNRDRFPKRYCFRLNGSERRQILRSQNATLGWGRHSKYLPLVFTEHGAVMLACVLRSKSAVTASLRVVDAFVRLRALIAEHDGLGRRIEALEARAHEQSGKIDRIFDILGDLLGPDLDAKGRPTKKIGFHPE